MSMQSQALAYRLIGHVAKDLTPEGATLGGTVVYAGLTAAALGAEVGIVTACASDLELQPITGTDLIAFPSKENTLFKNLETPSGRTQTIVSQARSLHLDLFPAEWRHAEVIHLAPIANEVELDLLDELRPESIYMTPQGWLRCWDETGIVSYNPWQDIRDALAAARAVVCSIEDLGGDPDEAGALSQVVQLLVVTRGEHGAWVFDGGTKNNIEGLQVDVKDTTGAGDIFAGVFFTEIASGVEIQQAALRANYLAAQSVTRQGLESIPTQIEIEKARGKH